MKYKDFYGHLFEGNSFELKRKALEDIGNKMKDYRKKHGGDNLSNSKEYNELQKKYREFLNPVQDFDSYEDYEEDEKEPYKIRGEYWIQDGIIQFADGDVGDYNHESIVMLHAQSGIFNLLDINRDPEYDRFEPTVRNALKDEGIEISDDDDLEEIFYNYIKAEFSESEADSARKLYKAASDTIDLRMFAKENWGWIWVRGNDVGIYKLTPDTKKHLIAGIEEILSDSGDEDVLDEQIELNIGVDKTGMHYTATLAELKDGSVGVGGTKADMVKKSDVLDKLDKSIEHPFYKNRIDENEMVVSNSKSTRLTTRFRCVSDPEEIDTIQKNYNRYANRAGIFATDLHDYISSGWGVVYNPYGSNSSAVGQFIGDVFAVSHYAPESDKDGIKMLLDLLHTSTPVIFAVPDRISKQLERVGFKKVVSGVPMYFKGEVMDKNILVNNSLTHKDLTGLLYHWMEEAKNNHTLNEHPKVKEFFDKLESRNNNKLKMSEDSVALPIIRRTYS